MAPIGGVRSGLLSGQDVIPNGVVDYFEETLYEDEGKTLSDYYAGDLSEYSRETTVSSAGDYSLRSTNGDHIIESDNGLPNYPSRGQTFKYNFYPSSASFGYVRWAWSGSDSAVNAYQNLVDAANDLFRIGIYENGGFSTLDSASPSIPSDEWLEITVDFGETSSDTISATLKDESGTELSTISSTNTAHDDGGIAFRSAGDSGAEHYWDNWRIA